MLSASLNKTFTSFLPSSRFIFSDLLIRSFSSRTSTTRFDLKRARRGGCESGRSSTPRTWSRRWRPSRGNTWVGLGPRVPLSSLRKSPGSFSGFFSHLMLFLELLTLGFNQTFFFFFFTFFFLLYILLYPDLWPGLCVFSPHPDFLSVHTNS